MGCFYLHDKITDDEGDECMSTFAVEAFSALKDDRANLLCFFIVEISCYLFRFMKEAVKYSLPYAHGSDDLG